eukprot:TRINITY_DN4232_c0_g1_i1.p1 TRINITY_DN4232_c0_g1~~TRINITY_DN4232_c0_g1_i1.p1  ORF type:complete len:869 (+),score=173.79 TRINITY_DN4232_c0_g1_i1:109-2607(+)
MRLYGANTDAGRVDVLSADSGWGTVCWEQGWGMNDADTVCKSLGFKSAVGTGKWHAGSEVGFFKSLSDLVRFDSCEHGVSVACVAKGLTHPEPNTRFSIGTLEAAREMFKNLADTTEPEEITECGASTLPPKYLIPTTGLDEVYIYHEMVGGDVSKGNALASQTPLAELERLESLTGFKVNEIGLTFDRTAVTPAEALPLYKYSGYNGHSAIHIGMDEPLRFRKADTALSRDGIQVVKDWGFTKDEMERMREVAYKAIEEEDPLVTSVVSGGAVITTRVQIPEVEEFLEKDTLVGLVKSYLGDDAVVSGYKATRLSSALSSEEQYVASRWHHDRVGRRLKLFIFLHDVDCDEGRPTQVAVPTHDILYHRTESFPYSRFHDAWVRANYNITKACGPAGGGFIFDTHTIHKGTQFGSHNRTTIIIEFHSAAKCPFVEETKLGLPCPSGDQRMLGKRLVQKKVLLPNGEPSTVDFEEGFTWRYLPGDVIPPVPPAAYLTSEEPKRGVCFYSGKQSVIHFDGEHGGGCEVGGGFTYGGFLLLLKDNGENAKKPGCNPDSAETLMRYQGRYLTDKDHEAFREVVGSEIASLAEHISRREACFIEEVLSTRRFIADPLNTLGLHLFRSLLAERMTDARRESRGLNQHPDYEEWIRNGFLLRDFDTMMEDGAKELRGILEMASGGDKVQDDLTFVPRLVSHVGLDTQYQAHVDTFHSVLKMWVYPSNVTLKEGPLHVLPGTHRNTREKLTWMYHATSTNHTPPSIKEESLRLSQPPSTFGLPAAVPCLPLPNVNWTIIIADTSSIHFRGYAEEGTTRISLRPIGGENDGGMRRLSPFRE